MGYYYRPLASSEAKKKLTEIQANKKHPYWDRYSKDHDQAVQEVTSLQRIITGETGRQV